MLTEADILSALRACFHPHPFNRPIDIVALGLVVDVRLTPDLEAPGAGIPGVPSRQALDLTLIAPTSHDDANAILLAQVRNRLAGLPELSRIQVALALVPAWTPERIEAETRLLLHLDPPAFRILNNR